MTDFDHLIKNKANGAQYPYKASAWKKFLHKGGIKTGLTVGQTVTIVISGAIIVGGLLWSIFRSPHTPSTPKAPVSQQQTDTTTVQPVAALMTVKDTSTDEVPHTNINQTIPPSVTPSSSAHTTFTPTEKINKNSEVKKVRKEWVGRPIHINPDTIKDNMPTEEQLRNGHSRVFPQ